MRLRTVILLTMIFLLQVVFASNLTLLALTGRGLLEIDYFFSDPPIAVSSGQCSNVDPIENLSESSSSQLVKLSEFQDVCDSFVSDQIMVFTTMPNSTKSAKLLAKNLSETLKEFYRYKVKPIVIVEPETNWGLIDFLEFREGLYNDWIKDMFIALESNGITNEMMGIWVPFPEANLPYWNRGLSTPADFARNVNTYLRIANTVFSGIKGSVLLNSATYSSDDFDWSEGNFASLTPYVNDLDPNLVSSFGLQGFPWIPPAGKASDTAKNAISPYYYLNPDLASEAARKLGTNEIWFNTGTFDKKYANDPSRIAYLKPSERKAILRDTITILEGLKEDGFNVWINIFAEDKSETAEATDWSYWYPTVLDTPASSVFKDFATTVDKLDIKLSLFDR